MLAAHDNVRAARAAGLERRAADLPRHDEFSVGRRVAEFAGIAAAILLLAVHLGRLLMMPSHEWWLPAILVLGALGADLASGLVHWTADTWGSETIPVIGRRLLRPFRVHHVNPDDFTRRGFLDVNGDVATIVVFFLLVALLFPLDRPWGRVAEAYFFAFCLVGLPTNQVHQWAHIRRPPAVVRFLQRYRVILSGAEHSRHHVPPYAQQYCIATGWCNQALAAIQFFPRLERLITRLTGLEPRADDHAFQVYVSTSNGEKSHD